MSKGRRDTHQVCGEPWGSPAEKDVPALHVIDVVSGLAEQTKRQALQADPSHQHEFEWFVRCSHCGAEGRVIPPASSTSEADHA